MSKNESIEAVIFDFDGVIADTEPLHYQSFCRVIERDGLACSWADYVRDYIGYDDRDLFRAAYGKAGRVLSEADLAALIQAKAAAFMQLTGDGVEFYDGIPDLIHHVHRRYPVGLCSGALRSDINPILAQLGLSDVFQVIVTAEDVPFSKPDPACYTLAVQRLGDRLGRSLSPAGCVAIEDTPGGIQSAKAAGLQVWGVLHTHGAESLTQADSVYSTLRDIMIRLGAADDE